MAILGKASIINEMALNTETVQLDGGEVLVSEIDATEYMAMYNNELTKTDGKPDSAKFTALLIARCIVDESRQRIFTDEEMDILRKGSTRVYTKLATAAQRVNGFGGNEVKNSKGTVPEGSSFGSVSTSDTGTPTT